MLTKDDHDGPAASLGAEECTGAERIEVTDASSGSVPTALLLVPYDGSFS